MGKKLFLVMAAFMAGLQSVVLLPAGLVSAAEAETAGAPPDIKPQPVNRAKQVLEAQVVNLEGVQLGVVGDLIIGKDGCIDYLVLSRGSAFGNVGPLVPVPWNVVQRWQPPQPVMIDFDYDVIKGAPGFDTWPQVLEPAMVERIRTYFGEAR
jgi:sporulation protein YlmC with PRC-barrel domain